MQLVKTNPGNEEIWVPKHDLFIDAWGHLVAPHDHGRCWIGHLVNDPSDNVAKEDRVAVVHLPINQLVKGMERIDMMTSKLSGTQLLLIIWNIA